MFAAGWVWVQQIGDDRGYVRRPGKTTGVSGSLGMVSSKGNGAPLFHCFTSSAPPFDADESYDRFGVFVRLKCRGDFPAGAKALPRLGYGSSAHRPRATTQQETKAGCDQLVHRPPDNPHRLAKSFLDSITSDGPPHLLRFWRGEFVRYAGGAYQPAPDTDVRAELIAWLDEEYVRLYQAELALQSTRPTESDAKRKPPALRPVTTKLVGNVLDAVKSLVLLPADLDQPAWIEGATSEVAAADVLSAPNGLFTLPDVAAGLEPFS
ncbi:MAG TPA: hypothetical protein VLM40_00995, partial [Gemmata sp.]|nr:hypothetical protein [Gemmata sp.]